MQQSGTIGCNMERNFQVLNRGEVKQFDHPFLLLQDKDGIFADMVRQTGKSYARRLEDLAEKAYYERGANHGTRDEQ